MQLPDSISSGRSGPRPRSSSAWPMASARARASPQVTAPSRVLAGALGGEHAVWVRRGARAEEVRHARGDVPERHSGAQQERAASAPRSSTMRGRREHLGRGGGAALRAPRARPGGVVEVLAHGLEVRVAGAAAPLAR